MSEHRRIHRQTESDRQTLYSDVISNVTDKNVDISSSLRVWLIYCLRDSFVVDRLVTADKSDDLEIRLVIGKASRCD